MVARAAFVAALLAAASAQADELDLSGFYVGGFLDGGTSTPTGGSEPVQFKYGYPYAGGFFGYSVDLGTTIIGFETLLSHELGSHTQMESYVNNGPGRTYPETWLAETPRPGVPTSGFRDYEMEGPYTDHYTSRGFYRVKESFAGQMGVRLGKQFGNWVIYGRVAGGISHYATNLTHDETGSQFCGKLQVRDDYTPGGTYRTVSKCLQPYGGKKEVEKITYILPTLSLAGGVEYNYSKLFTRVEAEGRHAFREGIGATHYNARLMVGVRF